MNLEEAQKKKVESWINEGLKLSEIQTRIDKELGVRLTYMEVRLLVDDLKLTLKDPEPPKPATPAPAKAEEPAPEAEPLEPEPLDPPSAGGQVSLTVDQITRPGAVISGKVTFSDGQKAVWYLDQTGRLGLGPEKQGYRPPASDVQQFQMLLESELSKLGF
jgi:hypothetical protein